MGALHCPRTTPNAARTIRARLNVLSELPEEWQACLTRWSGLNERRQHLDDGRCTDANEEYLLYQTLLGAWPLDPYAATDYAEFVKRMQANMLKALQKRSSTPVG
jgi:(1->4)-alpha-D-glucan 1-alpha-D-glucosylmutase